MSLRKSPQLTPALLAAARSNAQHSTGPRSPAAKRNSKLNGLKHGGRVQDENRCQAMLALGEDSQAFEDLKQQLRSAYGPGDTLWEKQIGDLAWLYCRRERVERAQAGLKRRALQAIDDWQHRRRQEMARITFDASQHGMLEVHLSESTDRGVTLRRTLSFLELIREEVKQRTFRVRQYAELESLYQGATGWRQALIFRLLHRFGDPVALAMQEEKDQEYREFLRKQGSNVEPPGEPEREELLRLLDEEIASVREEFEYAEKMNDERAAIERDACLAPEGETWRMMLRQEAALDRSIDRKVRILMRLRKESANLPSAPPGQDEGTGNIEEVPRNDISSRIFVSAAGGARGHGQDARATAGETPALQGVFQSAGMECSKMNDRCGNVCENKGSLFGNTQR